MSFVPLVAIYGLPFTPFVPFVPLVAIYANSKHASAPLPMSKLALASLCVALVSCAAQQAEYYIDQLADPRRQVRLDASHALVQLGGAAIDPLMDRATAGSDTLRYIAAQVLGQIGDRRSTPFLKSLLRDKNHHVREQAVRALGQLDDSHLHPTLAGVLSSDSVPAVRGAAAWSLGNLRDTTAVPSLVRALADTVPSVRRQALAALQFLWTSEAEAAALDALSDRDANVRYVAAQLLGHHQTHRALDALCLALTDDNIWVRVESARTLGRIGDTTAVAPLERVFAEREGPDHEAAKEALQLLTGLNYAVAP